MRFALNLLWLVFGGGVILTLQWVLLSCLFCVTIIGIPFGIAGLRIASLTAWPLGRESIRAELVGEKAGFGSGCLNIVWILLAGFWLALVHAVGGAVLCLTIVGIPFGIIHFKLAEDAFAPLGKRVVSTEVAHAAKARAADREISARLGRN